MTTALDVITDALQLLMVYAAGETVSDADAERGLSVLIDMLDDWSNQSLACYAILEQSAPLVPGKASYTIGTSGGADINQTRPLKILDTPGSAYVQDANGNNYQVTVVSRDRWNLIGNRSSVVTSNFPDTLFYDPQFPLGVINLTPFPTINYTLFWDSNAQLADPSVLSSTFSFPPGYKRAITTNLAICLKPYFKTAQIDPGIVVEAARTFGNIKRTNMRPVVARVDPELVSRAGPTYNIYTDGRSGGGV